MMTSDVPCDYYYIPFRTDLPVSWRINSYPVGKHVSGHFIVFWRIEVQYVLSKSPPSGMGG